MKQNSFSNVILLCQDNLSVWEIHHRFSQKTRQEVCPTVMPQSRNFPQKEEQTAGKPFHTLYTFVAYLQHLGQITGGPYIFNFNFIVPKVKFASQPDET